MNKLAELNKLLDEMIKRAGEIIDAPDTEGTFDIKQTELSQNLSGNNIVVGIGYGVAPEGLEGKCLILSSQFKWKIAYDEDDRIFLIPRKKTT